MRYFSLLILVLILGSLVNAQTNRVLEKTSGFSYLLPAGWVSKTIPGYQHKFALAPASQGFAPNVNFVFEDFAGSLPDYVTASKNSLKKVFKSFKILFETRASTKNAGEAIKLGLQNEQQGKLLFQAFYFVDAKTKKFVITCTTLPTQRAKLEPECDALVKTFSLE
jgi:hypothetical protein